MCVVCVTEGLVTMAAGTPGAGVLMGGEGAAAAAGQYGLMMSALAKHPQLAAAAVMAGAFPAMPGLPYPSPPSAAAPFWMQTGDWPANLPLAYLPPGESLNLT